MEHDTYVKSIASIMSVRVSFARVRFLAVTLLLFPVLPVLV